MPNTACRKCGRAWCAPDRVIAVLETAGILASCGVLALETREPVGPAIQACRERTTLLEAAS